MYTIQANPSGTRSMEISKKNLQTIEKYGLFRHLIDSTGIVDEEVLEKLKWNVRSLIASRITSYNVCYTKLLRCFQQVSVCAVMY